MVFLAFKNNNSERMEKCYSRCSVWRPRQQLQVTATIQ